MEQHMADWIKVYGHEGKQALSVSQEYIDLVFSQYWDVNLSLFAVSLLSPGGISWRWLVVVVTCSKRWYLNYFMTIVSSNV